MSLVLKVNLLLKHDLSISFLADFEECDSKMLSKIDFISYALSWEYSNLTGNCLQRLIYVTQAKILDC